MIIGHEMCFVRKQKGKSVVPIDILQFGLSMQFPHENLQQAATFSLAVNVVNGLSLNIHWQPILERMLKTFKAFPRCIHPHLTFTDAGLSYHPDKMFWGDLNKHYSKFPFPWHCQSVTSVYFRRIAKIGLL